MKNISLFGLLLHNVYIIVKPYYYIVNGWQR